MIKNVYSINIKENREVDIVFDENIIDELEIEKFKKENSNLILKIKKSTYDILKQYNEEMDLFNSIKGELELFIFKCKFSMEAVQSYFIINKKSFNDLNASIENLRIKKYISDEYVSLCCELALNIANKVNFAKAGIDKILLKFDTFYMLDGNINLEIYTEMSEKVFNEHFITLKTHNTMNKRYEFSEFRPIFRNFFMDIKEYCFYIIALVGEKQFKKNIRNPKLFTVYISTNCKAEVRFEKEFREVLESELSYNEVQYYLSELYIILSEIMEEITYIMSMIMKLDSIGGD